ncbi:MAG: radical SAM protein [Prolixibacteraceae bacterium]
MEYKFIDKIDDAYLISDPDKAAVSILDPAELIMFTLYRKGSQRSLKTFINQIGIPLKQVNDEIKDFTDKLNKEGWLREGLPVNNEKLLNSVYLNLTDACNYRCVYCYQGKAKTERPLNHFMSLKHVEYIVSKIKKINPNSKIILTGGEPFLHKNILAICKFINELEMSFTILTNGSLINDTTASVLATLSYLDNVQISIDGMSEQVHNLTRGKTYTKTIKGIETIIKQNVPFSLAPTMHDKNLKEITKLAIYAFENNGGFTPNNLRNFPHCTLDGFILSNDNFLNTLYEVEDTLKEKFEKEKIIEQKLRTYINRQTNRDHFICGAAFDIMDIDWNGDVYPCHLLRDKNLLLGNFLTDEMEQILLKVDQLKIRQKTSEIEKCKECHFMSLCGGGCKAAAYYSFGTFQKEDPLCDILYQNELIHLNGR